jgi:hypothetical protein
MGYGLVDSFLRYAGVSSVQQLERGCASKTDVKTGAGVGAGPFVWLPFLAQCCAAAALPRVEVQSTQSVVRRVAHPHSDYLKVHKE